MNGAEMAQRTSNINEWCKNGPACTYHRNYYNLLRRRGRQGRSGNLRAPAPCSGEFNFFRLKRRGRGELPTPAQR
eukprot:4702234-Alexandrium_andersonii.AAC.1